MKVFITGSESFVGRELVSQCLEGGIEVIGCDLLERGSQDYTYCKMDIRQDAMTDIVPKEVDAIIHLAALSRDQDCRGNAYVCFDVNGMGTLNVMRVASLNSVKKCVFASSEWVYDTFEGDEEKNEDAFIDITKHTSEYALSKLMSEANFRQQYLRGFCPVTILRFGIIYGPRKENWSAVESLMSTVRHQDEVQIGSLKTGRRFVHVSDIARGIIASLGVDGFEIINLTANHLITLGEIIGESKDILHKDIRVIESNADQVSVRNPSNNKAKRIMGWEPEIDLKMGLETLLPFV